MKTSTVSLVRLEPSEGMYLRNTKTNEVYNDYIYLAKSLSVDDFEEITEEEYQQIIQSKLQQENIRKFNRHSVTI